MNPKKNFEIVRVVNNINKRHCKKEQSNLLSNGNILDGLNRGHWLYSVSGLKQG